MIHYLLSLLYRSAISMPGRVGSNWGGVILSICIFGITEGLLLLIGRRWGRNTLIGLCVVAFAWEALFGVSIVATVYEDHRAMSETIAKGNRQAQQLTGDLTKAVAKLDGLLEWQRLHCLTETQVAQLASALAKHSLNQGTSTETVRIVYSSPALVDSSIGLDHIVDPGIRERSRCVADLLSAFVAAHWEPILGRINLSAADVGPNVAYFGIVIAYFTDKDKLPQYKELEAAFKEAGIKYAAARINFGFTDQQNPKKATPVIYVGSAEAP